jgi:hypothetical protein
VQTGFWWKNLRQGDHLEGLEVDGRIRLKMDLQEVGLGGTDWIDLAQDKDRLLTLINTVMNFWFPQNAGNFLNS